jgi:chaperone required for assembly of F1-ATPase
MSTADLIIEEVITYIDGDVINVYKPCSSFELICEETNYCNYCGRLKHDHEIGGAA